MWYNCLSEYLFKEKFKKNPYLSMHWKFLESRFATIAVYVAETPEEFTKPPII